MIEILERTGLDTFDVVGRWDETEGWVDGGDRLDFPDSEHYDEDLMLDRFDGPTLFARPADGSDDAEKAVDSEPTNGETSSEIDRENDGSDPSWAESEPVEHYTGPDDEDEREKELGEHTNSDDPHGRKYVDSVHEAPDDAVVHVETMGDDPDASKKLYYEP